MKEIADRLTQMKGFPIKKLSLAAVFCMAAGCNPLEELSEGQQAASGPDWASAEIYGSCSIDTHEPPLATKAMIDQSSSQEMEANFLRIDEDVNSDGSGAYTFGGQSDETDWSEAYVLEASVTASPNRDFLRSVYFAPVQTYNILVTGDVSNQDTIFYHTRMVGWHPRTCSLPEGAGGKKVALPLNDSRFSGVLTENADGGHSVRFTGLDGSKDLMFSDVREGQRWHSKGSFPEGDGDDGSRYRFPFGHFTQDDRTVYQNVFTFRHYLTAVRVWVYSDQSSQSISMWGDVTGVSLPEQPTSCSISIPDVTPGISTDPFVYGKVTDWGDEQNIRIITEPMYGEDGGNDPGDNRSVEFPVSLEGTSSANMAYVGYAMIRPDSDISIGIHTTSGVYYVPVEHNYKATENAEPVEIFKAGYIYDVCINLKTDGTIAALLENAHDLKFFDLTKFEEYDQENNIGVYKYANCYVVDPDADIFKNEETGKPYDGFCFSATVIGNGQAGILPPSGTQAMHTSSASISPVSARLVWESSKGLVSQVELMYGYVRFRVPYPDRHGNAVIAVYDENDNVLWSWHIWFTDLSGAESAGTSDGTTALDRSMSETVTLSSGNTIMLLDRNLGAERAVWTGLSDALATYGLYYQWGRKDPSMGPKSADYRITSLETALYYDFSMEEKNAAEVKFIDAPVLQDGVSNPMYLILPTSRSPYYDFNWLYRDISFLWGKQDGVESIHKTIYDPCPFGWRVSDAELNTLFTSGSTQSYNTFGRRLTVNGTQLYFPYTGYKGVDKGLNSVVCSWRYVGEKADYQTARYNDVADDVYYRHRERIYISEASSWYEINDKDETHNYRNHVIYDYTNRRTAAPVRCVKDEDVGSISANIYADSQMLIANQPFTLYWNADSYGSPLKRIVITAEFTINGVTESRPVWSSSEGSLGQTYSGSVEYILTQENLDMFDSNSMMFTVTAENEFGLADRGVFRMQSPYMKLDMERWNSDYGDQTFFVGQSKSFTFYLTGNVSSPTIYINGVALPSSNITVSGSDQSGYTYIVRFDHTFTASGKTGFIIDAKYQKVSVISGDESERTLHLTAESMTEDSPATSLNAGTKYVIKTSDGKYLVSEVDREGSSVSVKNTDLPGFEHVFSVSSSGSSFAIGNSEGDLWVNEDGVWTDEGWFSKDRCNWTFDLQDDGGFKLYYTTSGWFGSNNHYLFVSGNSLSVGGDNESSDTVFYFYPLKPEAQAAM